MFYLRTIHKETKRQQNLLLGVCYQHISATDSPQMFRDAFISEFKHEPPSFDMDGEMNQKVYGFISCDPGDFIPLYTDEDAYIMTSDGTTFARLNKYK